MGLSAVSSHSKVNEKKTNDGVRSLAHVTWCHSIAVNQNMQICPHPLEFVLLQMRCNPLIAQEYIPMTSRAAEHLLEPLTLFGVVSAQNLRNVRFVVTLEDSCCLIST